MLDSVPWMAILLNLVKNNFTDLCEISKYPLTLNILSILPRLNFLLLSSLLMLTNSLSMRKMENPMI